MSHSAKPQPFSILSFTISTIHTQQFLFADFEQQTFPEDGFLRKSSQTCALRYVSTKNAFKFWSDYACIILWKLAVYVTVMLFRQEVCHWLFTSLNGKALS